MNYHSLPVYLWIIYAQLDITLKRCVFWGFLSSDHLTDPLSAVNHILVFRISLPHHMWCVWSIWTSKSRWDRIIYAPEIHQELSSKHLIHDTMQTWICKLLCPYTTSMTEEQPYSLAPELHLGWGQVCTKALDFLAMERDYLLTRWWFQIFFIFTPSWGRSPFWLIFFNWVETTNQETISLVWDFFCKNLQLLVINNHHYFTKGPLLFEKNPLLQCLGRTHREFLEIPAWQQPAKG